MRLRRLLYLLLLLFSGVLIWPIVEVRTQRKGRGVVTVVARVIQQKAQGKVMSGALRHVVGGHLAVLAGKVSEHPQGKMGAASLHVPHPSIGIIPRQIHHEPHSVADKAPVGMCYSLRDN